MINTKFKKVVLFEVKAGEWELGRITQLVLVILLMLGFFYWPVDLYIIAYIPL